MDTQRWLQLSRALKATTAAGPLVAPSAARATVSRLRSGLQWAQEYRRKTGSAGSSHIDIPNALVIDRHSLIDLLCLDSVGDPWPGAGDAWADMRRAVRSLQYGKSTGSLWLCAPNILVTATRFDFDQADYAKWVCLQAAFFAEYLAIGNGNREAQAMARVLAHRRLEELSPRDISSVRWIRERLKSVAAADSEVQSFLEDPAVGRLDETSIMESWLQHKRTVESV